MPSSSMACAPPQTRTHTHTHATPSRASGASTEDGLPGTADLQDGVGHRADQRVAACMPDWVAVCAVTQARRSNRPCSNQSASAETVDRVRAGTNNKGWALRAGRAAWQLIGDRRWCRASRPAACSRAAPPPRTPRSAAPPPWTSPAQRRRQQRRWRQEMERARGGDGGGG
jgi:hypothetical protein